MDDTDHIVGVRLAIIQTQDVHILEERPVEVPLAERGVGTRHGQLRLLRIVGSFRRGGRLEEGRAAPHPDRGHEHRAPEDTEMHRHGLNLPLSLSPIAAPPRRGTAQGTAQWVVCITRITPSTAGPTATRKNDGHRQNTIGKIIFVPIFAAASSARCMRLSRNSSE